MENVKDYFRRDFGKLEESDPEVAGRICGDEAS